jgi:membrane-associated phospholipid phosphatase
MHPFFQTLPRVLRKIYSGKFILLQLGACVVTYALVTSGFDWNYFVYMQTSPYATFFRFAIVGGFILPVLVPFLMILVESLRKQYTKVEYGWMILQAAFLGWFISSTYKAFTGRIQPDRLDTLTDISGQFHFGFWEHGVFWGWPSSHTSVAFAIAFAVIMTTKHTGWKIAAFLVALYVGIGVSFSIHWFSEFAAGTIIGSVIGVAVGEVWRKKLV